MDAQKIGKSIAFLRKRYGMTQSDLADRLSVTDKAVSRWERGLGVPDISLLVKLSIILDTDIESILEGNLTHLDLRWKGILNMNYADGIHADTSIFGKCSVYLQMSFLMLAGVKDIYIRGTKRDVEFAQESFGIGEKLGLTIEYQIIDNVSLDEALQSDFFRAVNQDNGIMLINGLDFLYGKDVTKYFRRIMYDGKSPVRLADFQHKLTSIYFFPAREETVKEITNDDISKQIKYQILERGVITFSIKNDTDILNASTLFKIIEEYQEEKIADLSGIAIRRGLIDGGEIL